jgi:FAD/FMN-containing dehydrogenase
MANGSIVNVDAAEHPDLARAMRGSGSQFGIVTKFTVKVHPISEVWGGSCTYSALQDQELDAALHNFAGNGSQDPKAAIIFTNLVLAGNTTTKLIYYFYDGSARPTSGPFADFFKVPSLACLPKTQKYSELVKILHQI